MQVLVDSDENFVSSIHLQSKSEHLVDLYGLTSIEYVIPGWIASLAHLCLKIVFRENHKFLVSEFKIIIILTSKAHLTASTASAFWKID